MGFDPATMMLIAGGASAVTSIGQASAQKKAYDFESKQAQMEGKAQITERTRALTEAISAQNAMLGAQGRTSESLGAVRAGDIAKYQRDKTMIEAGVKSQSAQYKMAGKNAQYQGYGNAISSIAKTGFEYSMLGSKKEGS